MAVLYNDRSVLENHHMAYAWKLLDHEGLNFLDGWKDNDVQDPDRDVQFQRLWARALSGGHANDRTLYSEGRSNRLRGFDHQIIYCLDFTFPRMNSFSVYTLPYNTVPR